MNTSCPRSLAAGQHASLPGQHTLTVRCHAGQLWVTAGSDTRDHILQAGDCLHLRQASDILIGALSAARLDIIRQPVSGRSRQHAQAISG